MTSLTEKDRTAGKITFVASHHPALLAGKYSIMIQQNMRIDGAQPVNETFSGTRRKFIVQAPRFSLNPQQIQVVFPPEGSLGDHSNTLPHLVLTPSTLPWERSGAKPAKAATPWLALLVFYDDELSQLAVNDQQETVQSITAGELNIELEEGQHPDDPVSVIEVPSRLIKRLMPGKIELPWLTHVRQATDESGKPQGEEVAVIVANRLPKAGGMSIVHLVSVEQRYNRNKFDLPKNAGSDPRIRLISLKSWRFACVDKQQSFRGLLKSLDQNTLRLPKVEHSRAENYLAQGNIALPHAMRQGNKTVSWYRGPLVPGRNTTTKDITLPVRTADALIRYDSKLSMFDVSYAAAWELGRLLALKDKNFSLDLYCWKRAHAQKLKDAERQIAHLPFDGPAADLNLPPSVRSWFERTALLQGVPFHYLVADEALLPRESIRFFQVDWHWLECLLDGAYSIGRVLSADHQRERSLSRDQVVPPHRRMSGFLLRSDVVSGWPHLLVDGYDPGYAENQANSETKLLFSIAAEDFAGQLDISRLAELQRTFQDSGVVLSSNITIDRRCWIIRDAAHHDLYELAQIENNQIDVRRIEPDKTHLFSLDSGFEADLNTGRISPRLKKAFQREQQEFPADGSITVNRWFIADQDNAIHFIVEHVDVGFNIYRDSRLPLLRMERLSNNVLLCLFEGIVHSVSIHLKPEAIHYGVDTGRSGYYKDLRDARGKEKPNASVGIPLRNKSARVLKIASLAKRIKAEAKKAGGFNNFTSAEFSLEMVEGVPKVVFTLGKL